jgi:hypothetical protein
MVVDQRWGECLPNFLQMHTGAAARHVTLRTRRLHGGLVSRSVLHVSMRSRNATSRGPAARFIIKALGPESEREADIYSILRATGASRLAPALLGLERSSGQGTSLYLEAIAPHSAWPWRDIGHARRVLELLAELHVRASSAARGLSADTWSYESELSERAALTLAAAEQLVRVTGDRTVRSSLPALRRVVTQLPELRRRLLEPEPLPLTMLHGDVHSGNVIVRKSGGQREPVLIDWARARAGSPFEDVSSWLQSLGFWEPAVKRKHDTLLAAYLTCRGLPAPASREVRDAYWLAAASNVLAGALSYQLELAIHVPEGALRRRALCAAHDWLRVIRRADARFQGYRPRVKRARLVAAPPAPRRST